MKQLVLRKTGLTPDEKKVSAITQFYGSTHLQENRSDSQWPPWKLPVGDLVGLGVNFFLS